jgi:hypothetical protein
LFETTNDVAPIVPEVPGVRIGFTPVADPVDGTQYASRCQTEGVPQPELGLVTYNAPEAAAPAPAPELIAAEAYERVPLVAPVVQTSPPVGAPQLVGFPTWLWVDEGSWRTFDATAEVPGLSVTVTATPERVVWDMGDGNQVMCDGPGTPWVEGGDQTTDCEYTYQFTGTYTVTATITWAVTWEALPTGETGTLADATRSGTAQLTVSERQAVISHG